jgi:hypothetical protein
VVWMHSAYLFSRLDESAYFRHSLDLVDRWDDLGGLEEFLQPTRTRVIQRVETGPTNTYVLIEKLLTPIARALPLECRRSISAQVSLKVCSSSSVQPAKISCTVVGKSYPAEKTQLMGNQRQKVRTNWGTSGLEANASDTARDRSDGTVM